MRHARYQRRPDRFRIAPGCPLTRASFLTLGEMPGTSYVHDSSLYHRNGTLTVGAGDDAAGKWMLENGRRGLRLDGSDDYAMTAANGPSGAGQLSYGCRLKTTTTNYSVHLLDIGDAITDRMALLILGNTDFPDRIKFGWWGSNIVGTKRVNDGIEHAVVVNYDGTCFRSYVDGMLDGTSPAYSSLNLAAVPICIGAYRGGGWNFPGQLADVFVLNRCLTSPEIATYTSPDPMYGGWLLPPRRKVWPVGVAGAPVSNPIFRRSRNLRSGSRGVAA
jgi:hypothetical protein